MLKNILLLSALVMSIVTFAFFSNLLIGNSAFTFAQVSPTPTKNVSIKSVNLDKTTALLICPWSEEFEKKSGSVGCSKKDSERQLKIDWKCTYMQASPL